MDAPKVTLYDATAFAHRYSPNATIDARERQTILVTVDMALFSADDPDEGVALLLEQLERVQTREYFVVCEDDGVRARVAALLAERGLAIAPELLH